MSVGEHGNRGGVDGSGREEEKFYFLKKNRFGSSDIKLRSIIYPILYIYIYLFDHQINVIF